MYPSRSGIGALPPCRWRDSNPYPLFRSESVLDYATMSAVTDLETDSCSSCRCSRHGATGRGQTRRPTRGVGQDDRQGQAAARSRLPGRVRHGPCRGTPPSRAGTAMPPLLSSTTTRRSRSRSAAHRCPRVRDRDQGDLRARARQARAGHRRTFCAYVRALSSATIAPTVGGPTVDPQGLDDRGRVPRPRTPSLLLRPRGSTAAARSSRTRS